MRRNPMLRPIVCDRCHKSITKKSKNRYQALNVLQTNTAQEYLAMNNLINNLLKRNLLATALPDGRLLRERRVYATCIGTKGTELMSSVINNIEQKQWTMDCGAEIRLL